MKVSSNVDEGKVGESSTSRTADCIRVSGTRIRCTDTVDYTISRES